MIEPNQLDLAELRLDMRKMYKNIGYEGCVQALYEIILSANVLAEIMIEEYQNEEKS